MTTEHEEEEAPQLEEDEETEDLEQDERAEARNHLWASAWWERRRVEPEERDRILGQLFSEGEHRKPFLYRFALLQSMSMVIAALGIVADSPAIVIGAMLLSPLMIPVLAVAAALVMVWPKRILRTVGLVIVASIGSMALAWVVAWLMPDVVSGDLPRELVSRTSPTLIDLAVALAAGTAGGYAMVREEISSALPGVAVAVALAPPLAVVGAALDLGETEMAVGAGLLYLTNLSAIVLAGGVVFLATGFIPTVRITRLSWQVAGAVVAALIPVALLAIPLTESLTSAITDARIAVVAAEEVDAWLGSRNIEVVEIDSGPEAVEVDLTGNGPAPPASELGRRLEERLGREMKVTVHLVERSTNTYRP